jgi:hypothetical protein
MRVGTVPQGSPLNSPSEFFRLEVARSVLLPEVSTNGFVVLGRHLKRLERELTPQRLADISLTVLPSLQEAIVIGRIGKDGDPLVILGRSAEKRDAANINLLDRVCEGASRFRDGFGEGVEVADHDRDGRNRLGFEILFV